MELRPTLAGQLRQSITITPQVIQSIKLLKYGHEELYAYLREQEERNPLIEVVGGTPQPVDPSPSALGAGSEPTRKESASGLGPAGSRQRSQAGPGQGRIGQSDKGELRSLEETCAKPVSLREQLLRQVHLAFRDRVERIVAVEIVESIEPDGYLRRDLQDITHSLGADLSKVEDVLHRVQRLEPAGIAARSLPECLSLQLLDAGRLTPEMSCLLENLDLLANYNLEKLAQACGVDGTALAEMIRSIRELNPRPGFQFDTEPLMPALPDLKLEMSKDGSLRVELNPDLLPRVLVNREYYSEIRGKSRADLDTRYVVDCMKNATWLARNLDQRANTILKVATAIVTHQRDFFLRGVEHIRPLNQGEIAAALGMHPSTICRATSDKYILTSRGMFELKFFFSNGLGSTDGGDEVSSESIRAKIRHLVDEERADHVLSDDTIMSQLCEEGISIARRTVAKYREMMNIPSSQIRRRMKRAALVEGRKCVA